MPYHIERSGSQYAVVDDKGKTVGTHPTKGKAASQVRALYANVPDASKDDVIRYGRRRSGIGDSHSGMNTGGEVASGGEEGMSMSAADQIKELAAVVKQMVGEIPGGTPQEQEVTSEGYKDCGCETCKAMNCDCPDCPACSPNIIGDGQNAEFEATKPDTVDAYDNAIGKKDYPAKTRERMANSGTAMPDGSFPIANEADLHNAIQSVGRAKDYAAAKKHIIERARAMGMLDALPEDWKNSVKKTMWGGSVLDLSPFYK